MGHGRTAAPLVAACDYCELPRGRRSGYVLAVSVKSLSEPPSTVGPTSWPESATSDQITDPKVQEKRASGQQGRSFRSVAMQMRGSSISVAMYHIANHHNIHNGTGTSKQGLPRRQRRRQQDLQGRGAKGNIISFHRSRDCCLIAPLNTTGNLFFTSCTSAMNLPHHNTCSNCRTGLTRSGCPCRGPRLLSRLVAPRAVLRQRRLPQPAHGTVLTAPSTWAPSPERPLRTWTAHSPVRRPAHCLLLCTSTLLDPRC
jgi:hypothetical protein